MSETAYIDHFMMSVLLILPFKSDHQSGQVGLIYSKPKLTIIIIIIVVITINCILADCQAMHECRA